MKKCPYCGAAYGDDALVCPIDQQPLTVVAAVAERRRDGEKHSGLGIASFGISVGVGCLIFVAFVVAGFLSAGHIQQGHVNYPGQTIVGLAVIFLLGADVVAVALGIAALCQPGRKRLFGLLGLVFSAATILGTVGLMIVGLLFVARFAR